MTWARKESASPGGRWLTHSNSADTACSRSRLGLHAGWRRGGHVFNRARVQPLNRRRRRTRCAARQALSRVLVVHSTDAAQPATGPAQGGGWRALVLAGQGARHVLVRLAGHGPVHDDAFKIPRDARVGAGWRQDVGALSVYEAEQPSPGNWQFACGHLPGTWEHFRNRETFWVIRNKSPCASIEEQ